MPSWSSFQPFIPIGLALGGVYALSGVGMVVLYRATGVLNLAYGAIGAIGAMVAWSLITYEGVPSAWAYVIAVFIGGFSTLLYGVIFGPALAARDPLVKAVATLGFALILLGLMTWLWSNSNITRSISFSTDSTTAFTVSAVSVSWTQVIAFAIGLVVAVGATVFLRFTKIGTAMRALADDREITATLGVPVRRVEAAAWFGSGILAGITGLLLADLDTLDPTTLTFLVIFTVAAALIARLRSITVTFVAAVVIGLVDNLVTPINSITNYRDMTPFVLAIIALLFFARGRQYSFARGGIR
ncbi:MAG TPA: branched-chain amino acid ABC transporter permease [Solirubrobacteraceae bacterium]|jgi:branched-chain amino acid transport system permease protein